ncbi:MAG: type II secretion system secretin GspD [bacterium]|nr:type II secretion system secretin GspD [bacterium]
MFRPSILLIVFALLAQLPGSAFAQPADKDSKINLDFQETELTEVISTIAKLTGKNFLYDDRVRGRVTVISPQPVTVDAAYRVFESILQVKGFTTVPGPGGILKIVPTRDAKQSPIETVPGNRSVQNRDLFITRLLPLKYVKADAVSGTLTPLVSKEASVIAYAPTNTLIITDTSANIRRLIGIIKQIDVASYSEKIKVVPIEFADAGTLAGQLNEIFSGDSGNQNTTRRGRPRARAANQATGAAAALQANTNRGVIGAAGKSRFITDQRTNSIIVIATQTAMGEIGRMIRLLDYQRKGTGGIHVYRLQNADAEEISSTLASLTSGSGGGGAAPRAGAAGGAPAAGGIVAELGDGVRVTADAPTNSLIIQASSEGFSSLSEVIEALDIRRPQVLVEALIMEVDITDGASFGASLSHRAATHGTGQIGIGGANTANTPDAPALSGGFGSTTTTSTGEAFAPGQFSAAVLGKLIDVVLPNGDVIQVPVIQGMLQAAESDENTNIISAPTILTADNEEAEIVIGSEIPIPTTILSTQDSSNDGFQTSQDIARQNVGVTLRVTPQISEGDTVRLNIFQEISEVTSNDPDLGPTTSNRQVENTVYVRDGEAVMIGGILSEVQSESENKVPFLGDIPILGWAFKGVSHSTRKVNLLVVLTPRIVRDPNDLNRLTVEKRERFRDSASDTLSYGEEEREEREAALRAGVELPADSNPVRREMDRHDTQYPIESLPEMRRQQEEREKQRVEEIERLKASQSAGSYIVQFSLFRKVDGAVTLLERLTREGYDGSIYSLQEAGEPAHYVQLGPYATEVKALAVVREVRAGMDLSAIVIVEP